MARMKPIATVQLGVARLGLILSECRSDAEVAAWARSFYRALALCERGLNAYADELLDDVDEYRKAEAARKSAGKSAKTGNAPADSSGFQRIPPDSVHKTDSKTDSKQEENTPLPPSGGDVAGGLYGLAERSPALDLQGHGGEGESGSRRPEPASTPKPTAPRFRPPMLEDVAAYCRERANSVNPVEFMDYYEAKGWKIGSTPMKDWKAAVRNWEHRARKNGADGFRRNPPEAHRALPPQPPSHMKKLA